MCGGFNHGWNRLTMFGVLITVWGVQQMLGCQHMFCAVNVWSRLNIFEGGVGQILGGVKACLGGVPHCFGCSNLLDGVQIWVLKHGWRVCECLQCQHMFGCNIQCTGC